MFNYNLFVEVLENNHVINEDFQNKNEEEQANDDKSEEGDTDDDSDMELTFASREALYDPNSKQDLLEDFEIPPAPISEASNIMVDERPEDNRHGPFDVVLLGVNINPDQGNVLKDS